MIQDLIALLFHSRDYAHRAHLRTDSYSKHKALETFYEELTEKADRLTETWQGIGGMLEIGYYTPETAPNPLNPTDVILGHLYMVREMRKEQGLAIGGTMIQNQIDEIEAIFAQTIYKLTYLG